MFKAWGRGLYRARRLTLVLALLFAVGAGIWGTGVFRVNWWAPRPLRRLYSRYGISEAEQDRSTPVQV